MDVPDLQYGFKAMEVVRTHVQLRVGEELLLILEVMTDAIHREWVDKETGEQKSRTTVLIAGIEVPFQNAAMDKNDSAWADQLSDTEAKKLDVDLLPGQKTWRMPVGAQFYATQKSKIHLLKVQKRLPRHGFQGNEYENELEFSLVGT